MKRADIDRRFTEIVADYMAQGYNFCVTMSGSQGEEMKVDLIKGDKVVRINLAGQYLIRRYTRSLHLTVEMFTVDVERIGRMYTLWTGKGEQLLEEVYYSIDNEESIYTADEDELKRIVEIRKERFSRTWEESKEYTSERAINVAYSICKRTAGFKSVKKASIKKIERIERGFVIVTDTKRLAVKF